MGLYGFNTPYVRDHTREFYPIYTPGENYSFYFNSDLLIDDTSSFNFHVFILSSNDNFIADLGPVSVLNLNPSIYHLYLQIFVFPQAFDQYAYFQIWDVSANVEKVRSNIIQISNSLYEETTYVKYRHQDQLFNVRYDLLPDFYQLFRLPINQVGKPEARSEREQYRQSSDGRELRNSKSFRDLVLTLEMYWVSDEDLMALSALNEHSEVYIGGNRLILLSQIKVEKPPQYSNLSKSTFEAIVEDYDLDKSLLQNWGDFIFDGGNIFSNTNTFVQA